MKKQGLVLSPDGGFSTQSVFSTTGSRGQSLKSSKKISETLLGRVQNVRGWRELGRERVIGVCLKDNGKGNRHTYSKLKVPKGISLVLRRCFE